MYDASGEKTFAFNSSEHYVIDAVVMRDCKRMAAVTLGESDGTFADTVSIYSLGSDKADSVNTLTGSLLLSLDSVAGTLSCLTDESLTLFSSDGTLSGSYRYEYPYLRGSSMGGDNYAALLLSRYRSGSTMKLVTVSSDGTEMASLDSSQEVLSCPRRGSISPCCTATVWCSTRRSCRNTRGWTARSTRALSSCARMVRRC